MPGHGYVPTHLRISRPGAHQGDKSQEPGVEVGQTIQSLPVTFSLQLREK